MFDDLLEENNLSLNLDNTNLESKDNSNYKKSNFYKKKQEDIPQDPYIPVAVFVDESFSEEIKNKIYNIISKLISKGVTIRINGDNKEFVKRIQTLSSKHVEVYIPWKNFNDFDSKHYFNTATSRTIAEINFPGWDKIPDTVKSFIARNVRMIFGDKNNSICLCIITWTQDGASKLSEITKDTGRLSNVIRIASKYYFPVLNLGKPNTEAILEKFFGISLKED